MTKTKRIPQQEILRYKFAIRQNPPAPVYFTAAADTQTNTLFGLPGGYVVCGVRLQLITQFSGFGLSSCLVTIGANDTIDSTSSVNFYAPSFQCFQTPSPTTFMYWTPFDVYTLNPHDITVTATSTGCQLVSLVGGELEVTVLYRNL